MAQVIRHTLSSIMIIALAVAAPKQGVTQQVADLPSTASPQDIPRYIATLPSDVKGFFGEETVRELYAHTQREDLLGKWHPNRTGPDIVYRLPDGRLEIHEVKAYKDWPGHQSLKTTVDGQSMEQLSDDWLQKWIDRTLPGGPNVSSQDQEAARILTDPLERKRLVRVFHELNFEKGTMRSSFARPNSSSTVKLEPMMGPFKVERYLERLSESHSKLAAFRATAKPQAPSVAAPSQLGEQRPLPEPSKVDARNARARLFKAPVLSEFEQAPRAFDDYERSLRKLGHKNIAVGPGLLLPDGRLVAAVKVGVSEGVIVFAIDGGVAAYQYVQGDMFLPAFKRKVADAAVNGTSVGGATAVAVAVAGGPSGWVLLGVGIGAYFVSDTVMQSWHARNDRQYVSLDDLRNLGLQVESVLEPGGNSLLSTSSRDGVFGIKQSLDSPLSIGRSPPVGEPSGSRNP